MYNSVIIKNNAFRFDFENEEIADLFQILDIDKKGSVLVKDLMDIIASLGGESRNTILYRLLKNYEANGKKSLNYSEFIDLMSQKLNEAKNEKDIKKIYQLYTHNEGEIDFKKLRDLSKELGENIDDYDLQRMIRIADTDKKGKVDFEDFFRIMTAPYEHYHNQQVSKTSLK